MSNPSYATFGLNNKSKQVGKYLDSLNKKISPSLQRILDQINYIAYMDGHHKYLFDEENLINTLLTAGFKFAQLRNFDSNLDSKGRDYESIYALAKKI